MSQTVKGSAWEAITNVIVGFGVNYCANMAILPIFGFQTLTWRANVFIGVLYTAISLVRSFLLRRVFNSLKRFES